MEYMDSNPRKKARKSKKSSRRKKKNRARRAVAVISLLLIVAVIGTILSLTVFFKIENVSVTGNAVYSSNELITASGVKTGNNLFLTTTKSVSNNLINKFPFVESVSLKRILPSTLKIEITEAIEKYCYYIDGKYYSVSEKGKVLETYSDCPTGLILVKTASVKEANISDNIVFTDETEKQYFDMLIATLDKYKTQPTQIDMRDNLAITVRVGDRFDVNFGSIVDIDGKTAHLVTMVEYIDETKTGTINLSAWSGEKDEAYFVQGKLQ